MNLKMKKKTRGKVTTKITYKDPNKKEYETQDVTDLPPVSGPVVILKYQAGFRTSHSFQSFGVDVGIEFPVPLKDKITKKQWREVEEIVESKLAEKVTEAPQIIKQLIGLKNQVR